MGCSEVSEEQKVIGMDAKGEGATECPAPQPVATPVRSDTLVRVDSPKVAEPDPTEKPATDTVENVPPTVETPAKTGEDGPGESADTSKVEVTRKAWHLFVELLVERISFRNEHQV